MTTAPDARPPTDETLAEVLVEFAYCGDRYCGTLSPEQRRRCPECSDVSDAAARVVAALLAAEREQGAREAAAKAWREGAAAGHHSPLTWYALRQLNPYLRAVLPPEETP